MRRGKRIIYTLCIVIVVVCVFGLGLLLAKHYTTESNQNLHSLYTASWHSYLATPSDNPRGLVILEYPVVCSSAEPTCGIGEMVQQFVDTYVDEHACWSLEFGDVGASYEDRGCGLQEGVGDIRLVVDIPQEGIVEADQVVLHIW